MASVALQASTVGQRSAEGLHQRRELLQGDPALTQARRATLIRGGLPTWRGWVKQDCLFTRSYGQPFSTLRRKQRSG